MSEFLTKETVALNDPLVERFMQQAYAKVDENHLPAARAHYALNEACRSHVETVLVLERMMRAMIDERNRRAVLNLNGPWRSIGGAA